MGMSDVQILREAVDRVTTILAGRKVRVIQRGLEAKVVYGADGAPKEVHVPYIPDNASTELIEAVQGFIDHEIGHVLDSDFRALKAARAAGVEKLHNLIEDCFVEQCQEKRFRGSAYNLDRTRDFFLKNCVVPSFSDPTARKSALLNCACRAWSGQLVMQKFMEDKWGLLEGLDERIPEDFKRQLSRIKDSWQALELAKQLKEILVEPPGKGGEGGDSEGDGKKGKGKSPKDKASKKKPSDDKTAGDEKGTEDDKKDGEDKPKDKDKPEDKGKDKDEDRPDRPDSDSGEGDDADPDPDDADSDTPDDTESDGADGDAGDGGDISGDKGEGSGDGSEDAGAGSGSVDADEDAEPKGEPFMSDDEIEGMAGFDDAVSDAIEKSSLLEMKGSDYLVFTREYDTIAAAEKLRGGSGHHRADAMSMEEDVVAMVGPMQKELERLMAAKSRSVWESGRRSGRVNASALHRLATGDDRVFRKRIEQRAVETAVTLLVDASGSMNSGNRIGAATKAALALSMTLDRLNIPHEVLAFTTSGSFPGESGFSKAQKTLLESGSRGYGRYEKILMPILKSFGDRLTADKKDNFAWTGGKSRGLRLSQNVDGECVQYAAERLLQRQEARKVLLVLSDGEPCCPGDMGAQAAHLRKVVDDLNRSGVETVGIGIQTRAVERFYKKFVVLNNLDDLPTEVMRQLRTVLL